MTSDGTDASDLLPPGSIHSTAVVEQGATVHPSATLWHFVHVRSGAVISRGVSLGRDVYIDSGCHLGEFSRVQNGVSVYRGVILSPWSFVGPNVTFTNDDSPRAGLLDWKLVKTEIGCGAAIGAGSVIRCGVRIGDFSLIGAGSVVTRDVSPFHLAQGNPARVVKMVCACAESRLAFKSDPGELLQPCCKRRLDTRLYEQARRIINAM